MKRALFLAAAGGLLGAAFAAPAAAQMPAITVYRDTGCTCCEGWAAALHDAGYAVSVKELEHAKRLSRFAITEDLAGCHTALVGGYLIEGHVPVAAVQKLLRERPLTRGITLPGMPSGTPGMPGAPTAVAVIFLESPHHVFFAQRAATRGG